MTIATPALLLDAAKLDANVARMHTHLATLGVPLRVHVKTAKSVEVVRRVFGGGTGPITVSTLAEAREFADAGFRDILYAVGIVPAKLPEVAALRERGVELTVILDSLDAAEALAAFGTVVPALIEIDSDGHRAGLRSDDPALIAVAQRLDAVGAMRGVMTHAGGSYGCRGADALRAMAEQERTALVAAAERIEAAGVACSMRSAGSTPTAQFAARVDGLTEYRAGVYMFHDLVMAGLDVCQVDDIAISVLASVIGHQRDKGWILIDAGWTAMSRDRGTAAQPLDQGYGLVLDEGGQPFPDLLMTSANQEHGILALRPGSAATLPELPVGARVRILPNHACATAAQHGEYVVIGGDGAPVATWPRFGGW